MATEGLRSPPKVTNTEVAASLLALADAEPPGTRGAWDYRAAAATLRQLPEDLSGRRVNLLALPHVTPRAADAIASFLACASDEAVRDRLAAILDREDPARERKRDFLSRADVDRILSPAGREPSLLAGPADLRGDLHVHTDRSDGKMTLASLHRALAARGDSYALLTDHARDCSVAGGLFPGDFEAEGKDLSRLNERSDGEFVMFLGAEANIAEDGTIDVTPKAVPELTAVVASIHTDLRSGKDQTARIVRALGTPGVAILGHPRGRLFNVRTGVRADWARVFAVAAREGVAVELNGCPDRLDLDPRLARLASDAGCLFSVSSDAHAHRHLEFQRYALAVARLAGIPKERIVNGFSRERLAAWLEARGGLSRP